MTLMRERPPLMAVPTYRARLRFRLQKKLKIDANEQRLTVADRDLVLSAPQPEQNISDSEWLVINGRGFANEVEARARNPSESHPAGRL